MSDEDTRTRLLLAAGEAFAELGFEAATVREICRRAGGIHLASINYYFGDKEKLYIETIKFAHRFRAEQAPLPEWPPDTSAESKLRDFIHTMITRLLVVQELPWQTRLMMREFLQPTGACETLAKDFARPQFELLTEILGELVPEGTPLHRQQQLAFSVVGQCLFYRFHEPVIALLVPPQQWQQHFTPTQLADHITTMTLAALGRQSLFGSSGTSSVPKHVTSKH